MSDKPQCAALAVLIEVYGEPHCYEGRIGEVLDVLRNAGPFVTREQYERDVKAAWLEGSDSPYDDENEGWLQSATKAALDAGKPSDKNQ